MKGVGTVEGDVRGAVFVVKYRSVWDVWEGEGEGCEVTALRCKMVLCKNCEKREMRCEGDVGVRGEV